MSKRWIVDVEEDENGNLILPLNADILSEAGWKEGDIIIWKDNKDGSWTMSKKEETQWVLVETVSMFRERYMVEVPVGIDRYGKDKSEWALDTVTLEEAKEFSQKHLGETITSHRVVTMEEALKICDEDNDYCKVWSDESKVEAFFTTLEEHIQDSDYGNIK
jgi:hypothetical protein